MIYITKCFCGSRKSPALAELHVGLPNKERNIMAKSESRKLKVLCRKCKNETNHEVLFTKNDTETAEEVDVTWWKTYQLLQCQGCDEVTYRITDANSETIDPYTGQADVSETLYPNRTEGRPPIAGYEHFPNKTKQIYKETLKALHHNALILSAIGLRALIESICIEQRTKSKNLAGGIDELAKTGLLSQKQADFLHEHRFMGNVAAHEMVAPKATELVAALDIAETLLKTIYILPEVAAKMKRKPATKK
jgi:hypothetical protein